MNTEHDEAALRQENEALRSRIAILQEQNAAQWRLLHDPDGLAQRAIRLWNSRAAGAPSALVRLGERGPVA